MNYWNFITNLRLLPISDAVWGIQKAGLLVGIVGGILSTGTLASIGGTLSAGWDVSGTLSVD